MARPEPMNTTAQHPKVKVTLEFSDPRFVAGRDITGKFELGCRTEKDLAIGVIKAELLAVQELASRDHSARNAFIHEARSFQGPFLPPSNAVYAYPQPGSEPLPDDYYSARKGTTTFFFRFPTPATSPASIDFGKGLAKLKYEVRTTIGVYWKEERQLITDKKEIEILEYPGEPSRGMEQVVVGENGKLWAQARILNTFMVSNQPACIELFVKNHSLKKTSSLSLSITRHLRLDAAARPNKILQISDTLVSVPFKGPEYIVQPGTEGVANLAFTIPKANRGVRAGPIYVEDGEESLEMASLFHVQCLLSIRIGMGLGSKDVCVELPITVVHPSSLEAYGIREPLASPPLSPSPPELPEQYPSSVPLSPQLFSAIPEFYQHSLLTPPFSPQPQAYYWPPPITPPHDYYLPHQFPPIVPFTTPPRPVSADPHSSQQLPAIPTKYPVSPQSNVSNEDGELGKGKRASRISARLHRSSRNRSVSPFSHRFPTQLSPLQIAQPQPASGLTMEASVLSQSPARGTLSPIDAVGDLSATTVLYSPRPMLSPKHSFHNDKNGTGKSLRVGELEKMAEKEVAEQDPAEELQDQSPSKASPSTVAEVPRDPPLAPIRPRLSYRNGQSGLEALERRLMQQVGTKKPDSDRQKDVRRVLTQSIEIPSRNERSGPDNEVTISSLALTEEEKENDRPSETTVKAGRSPRQAIHHTREANVHEREKRVQVQHLRKAATGRVAAWLDSIGHSESPTETVSLIARSSETSTTGRNDFDAPVASKLEKGESSPSEEALHAVPTRSSGFVLRRSANESEAFVEPSQGADKTNSEVTGSTPKPSGGGLGLSRTTEDMVPQLPPKRVLERYAFGRTDVSLNDAKYPVQSARGGRGGKVTSVAAMWAAMAEGQDQRKVSYGSSEGDSSKVSKPLVKPPAPKKLLTSSVPNFSVTNSANNSSPRPAIVKSTSVPATVSSSIAKPLLSSTASLARPPSAAAKKIYPPSVSSNNINSSNTHEGKAPKVPNTGEMAFGQARLKDLIRKYQQGV